MRGGEIQSIRVDHPFSLALTVESHGWFQLAPWEWDGSVLRRRSRIGAWSGQVEVWQTKSRQISYTADHDCPGEIENAVIRWLSLDWDPEPFLSLCDSHDAQIADFVRSGGGRFLRGDTFFEDLVKTICTVNTTWRQTKAMVLGLVDIHSGFFPMPVDIMSCSDQQLRNRCKLGFRKETLRHVTGELVSQEVINQDGSLIGARPSHDHLLSLKGVGPYTAAHSLMLLRDFSMIPVDSEVSASLISQGIDPKHAQEAFAEWGEYRFLAYKLGRIVNKKNWLGN
jgi:N-glycosylase/DNA lyase